MTFALRQLQRTSPAVPEQSLTRDEKLDLLATHPLLSSYQPPQLGVTSEQQREISKNVREKMRQLYPAGSANQHP